MMHHEVHVLVTTQALRLIVGDNAAKLSTRIFVASYHKFCLQGCWCANSQNSFQIYVRSFVHVDNAAYSDFAYDIAFIVYLTYFCMMDASLMTIMKPVVDLLASIHLP